MKKYTIVHDFNVPTTNHKDKDLIGYLTAYDVNGTVAQLKIEQPTSYELIGGEPKAEYTVRAKHALLALMRVEAYLESDMHPLTLTSRDDISTTQ